MQKMTFKNHFVFPFIWELFYFSVFLHPYYTTNHANRKYGHMQSLCLGLRIGNNITSDDKPE